MTKLRSVLLLPLLISSAYAISAPSQACGEKIVDIACNGKVNMGNHNWGSGSRYGPATNGILEIKGSGVSGGTCKIPAGMLADAAHMARTTGQKVIKLTAISMKLAPFVKDLTERLLDIGYVATYARLSA